MLKLNYQLFVQLPNTNYPPEFYLNQCCLTITVDTQWGLVTESKKRSVDSKSINWRWRSRLARSWFTTRNCFRGVQFSDALASRALASSVTHWLELWISRENDHPRFPGAGNFTHFKWYSRECFFGILHICDLPQDGSNNCYYNFGTFDNFGVKNDQKVSHNMILMSKYKGQHGGKKD